MKTETLKQRVIEKLIAGGNNAKDVAKMVEDHFDYASSQYSGVKCICECIRTIY